MTNWTKTLILAGAFGLAGVCSASARAENEQCAALDAKTTTTLTGWVAAKYHVTPITGLSLKSSEVVNHDCYRKLEYVVLGSGRDLTLYLTPDRKYLLPALYDTATDPLLQERQERDANERTLTAGHPSTEGPASSPVTIVEFSDFQCPYCSRLTAMLEKDLLPANPDIRVIFRNFPLPMHPWAQTAAQIASCAQMQGDAPFWKMHDYIFSNQKELTLSNVSDKLLTEAETVPGLNQGTFHRCVDDAMTMGIVAKDVELGKRFGVQGTPTVFINGTRVPGIRDSQQLKQLVADARSGHLDPSSSATPQPQRVAAVATDKSVVCKPAN